MYQKKTAYGSNGFPWSSEICKREVSYRKGICPVAEQLNDSNFMSLGLCVFDLNNNDIELIISAFQKVWNNMAELKEHATLL